MSWLEYHRLLEKYKGNISNATEEEIKSAEKGNPNNPDSALRVARMKYLTDNETKIISVKKIWVVMGTVGEYSERSEWPVVAFDNQAIAENYVEVAGRKADIVYAKLETKYGRYNIPWNYKLTDEDKKYDSNMSAHDRTTYYLEETNLREVQLCPKNK